MAQFKWRGDKVKANVAEQTKRALFQGCSHILNEANQIAPHDEGILTQTAGVDVDEQNMTGSVYYVQKYAPRLHEHPEYNFQKGRQGKWLEQTVLSEGDKVRDYMANEIKKAFGGGS